ncbi:MAG: MBL fold metallo-hydrolase [Acidobacteria bacterium]|nr:MBL fold metallo-hydrolase [Acidobacteriota bacterium]
MELIILGSGTAVPHPVRAASAHWLETSSGSLLLDASAASVHRMAQEGLAWEKLDAIWISHFHLDHIGGLAPFLFGTRHAPQTRTRRKPLMIYGGYGLKKLLRAFDEANSYKLFEQPFPVEVREVAPRAKFELLPGLAAQTFSTPHTRESLALRLTDEAGVSLVYTSDTGYAEALGTFARGANLLLMECSFWRDKPVETHLELADAMRLARRAAPQRVVLSHLYPEWDDVDIEAEARRLEPGCEVLAARDGLRLNFQ